MGLNIPDPRLYVGPNGNAWPAESDVAHGSYVTGVYHGPYGDESINGDIKAGKVQPTAAEVLARAGHDGAELTPQDKTDLSRFADQGGHSFAYNIHVAYEAFWIGRGDYSPTGPTQPPVQPPIVNPGNELYLTGHDISAKLEKGTKGRRSVYALETAWGGVNAAIIQAGAGAPASPIWQAVNGDGVETCEEQLKLVRQGLLDFFHTLSSAAHQGREFLAPHELEQCQEACDRVWNTFHACRKIWAAAKQDGWVLVAGDPRPQVWQWSRLNQIVWTALSNMTVACGLYGLSGEITRSGIRAAEYVDSFESWENQDPNQTGGGEGGINVPGGQPSFKDGQPSFAEATAKKWGLVANEQQIIQHLNNILSDAHAAKALVEGGVEPPPASGYELKTVGRNWLLDGTVENWNDALVFPPMEGLAGFSTCEIKMTIEVGANFDGRRNFIYLTENSRRWNGDVVLLVNRGENGAMAVSNTLEGLEVRPARQPWPMEPGRLELVARLANRQWAVTASGVVVKMPIPATTSTRLVLQLGNSVSDGADHPTNAGWKLIALNGSVS